MNNLKELKKYILSTIDENWPTIDKVRYVYLESGKKLEKHTEFFLTIDNKLTDTKLSPKRLDKIYIGRLKTEEWNKLICKSGAYFIKEILDELRIKSTVVETVRYTKYKGMKNHIHHYFLSVDIDGKNIFLTPAADYGYIQSNYCTLRFGSEINYIVDGSIFYKGPEIPHITLSRKDVKEIDDRLGYTLKIAKNNDDLDYYTEYIEDIYKKSKNIYIDYMAKNTNFYKSIMPEEEFNRDFKTFSDPRNNWNFIIDKICMQTGIRIAKITGNTYKYKDFISRSNFIGWCKYIESLFNPDNYNEKEVFYSSPKLLYNKAKALCNLIIIFYNKIINNQVKSEEIKQFNIKFLRLLNETSKHFIDERFVIEPKNSKEYVSNVYLNNKFSTFFPLIMNANIGYKNNPLKGFSEQTEIVKRNIELLFQELNSKNLLKKTDNNLTINPIFKRINLYSVRKRGEDGYYMYFAITDSDMNANRSTYWYMYDADNNKFEKTSLFRIVNESSKYGVCEVLSNRLKSELMTIEEAGTSESLPKGYKLK